MIKLHDNRQVSNLRPAEAKRLTYVTQQNNAIARERCDSELEVYSIVRIDIKAPWKTFLLYSTETRTFVP